MVGIVLSLLLLRLLCRPILLIPAGYVLLSLLPFDWGRAVVGVLFLGGGGAGFVGKLFRVW